MYQGKRYKETRFGQERRPNILLRIIISVSIAVIISFALILMGAKLGEMVPEETTADSEAETTKTPSPVFELKEIEERTVSELSAIPLFGEASPDLAVLNVSNENGKLNCITSINSLLYGSAVSSELRPIEALLYEAKAKAAGVSVRFTPFSFDGSEEYADLCSCAVIGAISGYDVNEIVICLDGVTPSLASRLKESANGNVKVGGAISLDVLKNEALVKQYYSALDFLVLDLTDLELKTYKDENTESDTTSAETETARDATPTVSVESAIRDYGLLMVKYSVRVRITCDSEQTLSDFLEIYKSFELCGFEVDSKKQ